MALSNRQLLIACGALGLLSLALVWNYWKNRDTVRLGAYAADVGAGILEEQFGCEVLPNGMVVADEPIQGLGDYFKLSDAASMLLGNAMQQGGGAQDDDGGSRIGGMQTRGGGPPGRPIGGRGAAKKKPKPKKARFWPKSGGNPENSDGGSDYSSEEDTRPRKSSKRSRRDDSDDEHDDRDLPFQPIQTRGGGGGRSSGPRDYDPDAF